MTPDPSTSPARPTGRTRAVVLGYLARHPGATPRQIADGTGMSHDLIKKTAARMRADGELTVAGERGHYYLTSRSRRRHLSPVPPSGDTPDAAGTVSSAQAGDTKAESDAPTVVSGDTPNAVSAAVGQHGETRLIKPRCPGCYHRALQPVEAAQITHCEACGLGFVADDGVPR